jgi:ABC-type multidrug transport system fused ATPase/permease subunit
VVISGFIAKHSANAFRSQQAAIGKVNGYIEEMIEGQKVVKVFCREEKLPLFTIFFALQKYLFLKKTQITQKKS